MLASAPAVRFAAALCLITPLPAAAQITKAMIPTETGFEPHWWPEITAPAGWSALDDARHENNCKALTPAGQTFRDAPAVIYACATRREGDADGLAAFLEQDQAKFLADDPSLKLERLPDMVTAAGGPLTLYRQTPGKGANWELVAYGQETDADGQTFFLTFVLSARSPEALSKGEAAYKAMVAGYR
ncbi:MAG: hypothetical protein QM608_15135 [Caulobacter sp.]